MDAIEHYEMHGWSSDPYATRDRLMPVPTGEIRRVRDATALDLGQALVAPRTTEGRAAWTEILRRWPDGPMISSRGDLIMWRAAVAAGLPLPAAIVSQWGDVLRRLVTEAAPRVCIEGPSAMTV
jgi:hypothetical protein